MPSRTYRIPRPVPRTLRGEIIGRTALAILGLAFLIGGYKCIRTAIVIERDFEQRASHTFGYTRSSSGAGVPLAAGGVLLLVGAPLFFAALFPVGAVEKLLGRQTNNTLHENSSPASSLRDIDGFL
jgi:hypothetical protein